MYFIGISGITGETMARKTRDKLWKVTFLMIPPFSEGCIRVWAPDVDMAIKLARATQNLKEITSAVMVGRE